MPHPTPYTGYAELQAHEQEGRDYRIIVRPGSTGILVMAPHGGNIEPGCSEIAEAVAGQDHSYYSLEGLKAAGNRRLHLPSTRFDEPICLEALKNARKVLAIHGCRDHGDITYLGGMDEGLRETVRTCLLEAGFGTGVKAGIQGRSLHNICNRGASGRGVQLEIAFGLRCRMFSNLMLDGRQQRTEIFHRFVSALRAALA